MKIHTGTVNITFISISFEMFSCFFCSQVPVVLFKVLNLVFKYLYYLNLQQVRGCQQDQRHRKVQHHPFHQRDLSHL